MNKEEFLKKLGKTFGGMEGVLSNSSWPGGIQEYEVSVRERKDNLFANDTIYFYVENEGMSDERVFFSNADEKKQEEFQEKFEKKVESFRLS